jgi:ATP-dependent DNA helicase RecG
MKRLIAPLRIRSAPASHPSRLSQPSVEQVGSGVRRIREICRNYGVEEPEYEVTESWVTVTFARPKLKNGVRVKEEGSEKTSGLVDGLAEGLVEATAAAGSARDL